MRRFIFYFVILVIAVLLGIAIHKDPGYVLITYQNWSLETTLWFALLAFVVLFFILYFLLRIFRGTSSLAEKWHAWSERRKEKKSNKFTFQGLCQLAEGDWKQAEKSLLRGVNHTETPIINYLAAANAAQHQDHFEERDNYLRLAYQTSPQAEIAIALTQAQLQVSANQWELALATLRHLQQMAPHQVYVLKLLTTVYIALKDWDSLEQLLPELRKYKVLESNQLTELEQQVYFELLKAAATHKDFSAVTDIWQNIPKHLQYTPVFLQYYANLLIQHQEENKAEALIRDALKKSWDSKLLFIYGDIASDNLDKQIMYAEGWLKTHPNDPALQLCLGKLCARNQLWDKARDYFAASVQMNPAPEALRELGRLYEQRNEIMQANYYYNQALFANNSPT